MSAKKVAVITGSGKRRIGWHVARALGRRGYRLALHYYLSATDAQQAVADFAIEGIDAHALQADFGDETATTRFVEQVWHHYGRVDVLVNCAAAWGRKRLDKFRSGPDPNSYRRKFRRNR